MKKYFQPKNMNSSNRNLNILTWNSEIDILQKEIFFLSKRKKKVETIYSYIGVIWALILLICSIFKISITIPALCQCSCVIYVIIHTIILNRIVTKKYKEVSTLNTKIYRNYYFNE